MNKQTDQNQQTRQDGSDSTTDDYVDNGPNNSNSLNDHLNVRGLNAEDINNRQEIGMTIASDKHLNTIDYFWFALNSDTSVRPFDFVTIEHQRGNKTIGMIQDIQTVASDQNYIAQVRSMSNPNSLTGNVTSNTLTSSDPDFQHGINIAKAVVMANSEYNEEGRLGRMYTTGMPVGIGRSVRFSDKEEVMFALGVPEMVFPIPAGIIEMSNGKLIPISLDITYLVGPDTAHANASGISGNAKTSYLLFLLQSMYQKFKEYKQEFAIIIFNTKEKDLLQIDKVDDENGQRKKETYFNMLNLDLTPFNNVTHFLPRGKDGKPNSALIPENFKTYSYELSDVYDRLELLFSEIYDPRYNLSSIINYIYEFWPVQKSGKVKSSQGNIKTWTDLFNFKDYPEEIITHKSSLLHFKGHIERFRRSSLFIDKKKTSTYLGKEIKQINPNDVFVIDIAMLSTLEEQAFVIGDVMRSIDEMYSSKELVREGIDGNYDINVNSKNQTKRPRYLLVFIDEINRFFPSSKPLGKLSTIAEQIFKTVIAGRSRGTILFSAQQFKSAADYSLHENTGTHITAKVGSSELSTPFYNMMDESTKMNIIRLNRGELVIIHSAFRHPIKITFPRPSFRKR